MISYPEKRFKAVTIGTSAGGVQLLPTILEPLPENFPIPLIIIQHMKEGGGEFMVEYLDGKCRLKVKEAIQLEKVVAGHVYLAPADYHLYIDDIFNFSLSVDAKVRFSRPSIDVFFEAASKVFTTGLIGIILTGANNDGTDGMRQIKKRGGVTIVQNPDFAEVRKMPESVIVEGVADYILRPSEIAPFLIKMVL